MMGRRRTYSVVIIHFSFDLEIFLSQGFLQVIAAEMQGLPVMIIVLGFWSSNAPRPFTRSDPLIAPNAHKPKVFDVRSVDRTQRPQAQGIGRQIR
jgi:hypothetical protein